jgi:plasmid stabilization system protein ParE
VAGIVELLPGARFDFDESFDWYAQRSEAAAVGFRDAVEETNRGCRYYPLKRYPFRIIFHHDETSVVIIAIAHAKRRPNYWHKRI